MVTPKFADVPFIKGALVHQCKAKAYYEAVVPPGYVIVGLNADEHYLIMECDDTVASDDGKSREHIPGKAILNNTINCLLFELLSGKYCNNAVPIKTHYVEKLGLTTSLVKAIAQPIPLEVIVRNRAYGSFARRHGIPEGSEIPETVCEFTIKDDELNDPLISVAEIVKREIATDIEVDHMREVALAVNQILQEFFREIGIELADFKLVFGRQANLVGDFTNIRIIGELDPDICRLRDMKTGECLDKDIFRKGLSGLIEAYEAVSQRITEHNRRQSDAKLYAEIRKNNQ